MRIIIRFSVDDGAPLYRELAGHLNYEAKKRKGPPIKRFEKTGTATWEGEIEDDALPQFMATFWDRWASQPGGKLDHVWMYADYPREQDSQ